MITHVARLSGPRAIRWRPLARLIGRVDYLARRHAAVRELSRLPDHVLADIGLQRAEIASTVERLLERGQGADPRVETASSSLRTPTDLAA